MNATTNTAIETDDSNRKICIADCQQTKNHMLIFECVCGHKFSSCCLNMPYWINFPCWFSVKTEITEINYQMCGVTVKYIFCYKMSQLSRVSRMLSQKTNMIWFYGVLRLFLIASRSFCLASNSPAAESHLQLLPGYDTQGCTKQQLFYELALSLLED